MSGKISWNRPSGVPIETNDRKATVAYLESLNWTQIGTTPVENAAEARAPRVAAKKAKRSAENV